MIKHHCDNGDWGRSKRVRKHPLLGIEIFSDNYGYVTITKMWKYQTYWEHVSPHDNSFIVSEIKGRNGLRYIVRNYELLPHCVYTDGSCIIHDDERDWMLI